MMKAFRPGNFLFRSYVLIVLGIVFIALLLDTLLAARTREDIEDELHRTWAPFFSVVSGALLAHPEDEREARLAGLSADWEVPASLLQLADFAGDPELAADLDGGALLVFSDSAANPLLYQRLGDSAQVLAIGPLEGSGTRGLPELAIIAAYYVLVALLVWLWIRPFHRDLTRLREAAAAFGRENFSTRVQIGGKSSILPVAQSFNAMAERIEYLVLAHKELTHAVSHELRTPLARIRFGMEILARQTDPARQQYYLDSMKADVSELETLIDELLSYARLSEQNLLTNPVETDLRAWLLAELEQYADTPVAVTCSFSADSPGANYRVFFNPDLMARAVNNVIRNGLRYACETITVHAHRSGNQMEIRICDDGPGIPEAMKELIFEPFARLETSRDKSSGGYGLGLAIAARILERHKGHISVVNCAPTGACFVLQWPDLTPAR